MKCSNCGFELPEDSKFCSKCGKAQDLGICCPKCGGKIKEGTKFCTQCGAKVIEDIDINKTNPANSHKADKGGNKSYVRIFASVGIFAVLAIVGTLFFVNSSWYEEYKEHKTQMVTLRKEWDDFDYDYSQLMIGDFGELINYMARGEDVTIEDIEEKYKKQNKRYPIFYSLFKRIDGEMFPMDEYTAVSIESENKDLSNDFLKSRKSELKEFEDNIGISDYADFIDRLDFNDLSKVKEYEIVNEDMAVTVEEYKGILKSDEDIVNCFNYIAPDRKKGEEYKCKILENEIADNFYELESDIQTKAREEVQEYIDSNGLFNYGYGKEIDTFICYPHANIKPSKEVEYKLFKCGGNSC